MTSFVTGTYTQEPIIYQPQQDSEPSYVAGSHMLTLWSQPSDVGGAIAQFGGVQECSEHINARVDSEFFEGDLLSSCKQEAAGYDVKELLQLSEAIVAPSEEQTTRLCRAESCAAWLSQAAEATWLPECRYRQSQMSFRSLVETLLRIREDLVATGMSGAVIAPNASLFREFYQLNQLSNLLNTKENAVNEVGSPVMVARQLSAQEDFSLMGSGDSPQLSAAVEPPGSSSGTTESTRSSSSGSSSSSLSTSNSASVSSGSSSSSDSNSVGDDFLSGSNFNSSDTAGFTSSGVGPHASSTATTTELTPSYAYVVGAWVLFNGSYFFLMRRK
ncbi:hypothetical protein JG687_00010540 [Phytophthora cactorum]|uniref:Uncharacterized protein n=1 Tax=Phytophthora cactorum TaxID=29920 RepID=A0A329SWR4_9STRA|nr:hypothetical protein Pcac1_g13648 [Phytophthora cactorum]KAG2842834.1 hypothetical protein PC111_g2579 [Phytophthora cactorum]KAG2846035.1 hypothetical protein PC112_g1606 [Phytophthora cactorum]KAG2867525.1 hypothetical protein PC113_g1926 [Phytophthora cactorum]KAG2927002.1 hypothetical protein PC115_g7695 [Phytophthora cactorum]